MSGRAVGERAFDGAVGLHVAGLDHADAVRGVQRHRRVELAFVVLDRAGRFVVADEPHASLARVRGEQRQVEVGIRLGEAEVLAVRDPVAVPALVPAFDQHAAEAVLRGEVDVALHVGVVGAVLLAAAPGGAVEVHLPPDADVLADVDPRGVGEPVRLVEVQLDARIRERHRRAADQHRAPRRDERAALAHQHAVGPGHQVRLERALRGAAQVHAGVIDQRGLVDG